MRTWFLATSLLLLATTAHAQPGLELDASSTATSDRPRVYVATGAMIGGAGGHTGVGLGADLGVQVYEALWVHAGATTMANGELFGGSGSFQNLHAGLELSTCHTGDHVCAFAGADLGWAHSEYWESDWFGSGMGYEHDGMVGVIRAGLDVGGKHVRWRPGFEGTVGTSSAGGITNSLVVQF